MRFFKGSFHKESGSSQICRSLCQLYDTLCQRQLCGRSLRAGRGKKPVLGIAGIGKAPSGKQISREGIGIGGHYPATITADCDRGEEGRLPASKKAN